MADKFQINSAYAEKYNKWREKEELQKLKDRYGEDYVDDESSTSESEDEDAEALTAQVEKDWLRTLSAVKTKDPKIYDQSAKFYHSDDEESVDSKVASTSKEKYKKDKPFYLKDYERKLILEKGGIHEDEIDSGDEDDAIHEPGYYEEQEELRMSFKTAVDDRQDSDEDFLKSRKKSSHEKKKEEEEYLHWLKGQKESVNEDETVVNDLKPLKKYWTDPKLGDDERFLRDYILNKRYKEDENDEIPTYNEIIDEEEDEELDKAEEFERKFNFRFEEPDQEFIKSYPRTIENSMRQKETKRAQKRQEVKERKLREKEKKREEIKQLKNLKKKEIMSKIDKIKETVGDKALGLTEADVEGDFDPLAYDRKMQELFSEEYYGIEESGTKPTFDDDDEELAIENWDEWTGGQHEEDHYDPDFVMDADYDPTMSVQRETKKDKKRKRKSKFAEVIERKKPVFDPEDKAFEEYIDEYYKLDYEDIIGDLPCRFKYRQVVPNDFGLSVSEVLSAKDKELNSWVSLKKMSQYRSDQEEFNDRKIFEYRGKNVTKKAKIFTSNNGESQEEIADDKESTKNTLKKRANNDKKKKNKEGKNETITNIEATASTTIDSDLKTTIPPIVKNETVSSQLVDNCGVNKTKKKLKKKNKCKVEDDSKETPIDEKKIEGISKKKKKKKRKAPNVISDERLKAYGINPKKLKYTLKVKEKK